MHSWWLSAEDLHENDRWIRFFNLYRPMQSADLHSHNKGHVNHLQYRCSITHCWPLRLRWEPTLWLSRDRNSDQPAFFCYSQNVFKRLCDCLKRRLESHWRLCSHFTLRNQNTNRLFKAKFHNAFYWVQFQNYDRKVCNYFIQCCIANT